MKMPLAEPALAAAICLALAACGGGSARPAEAPAADRAAAERVAADCPPVDSAEVDDADISITATVRARELRHAEAPRASVRFPGTTAADTLSCSTRSNLERPVRAGRTYRDVRIDYRLRVRIDTAAAGRDTAMGDTSRAP